MLVVVHLMSYLASIAVEKLPYTQTDGVRYTLIMVCTAQMLGTPTTQNSRKHVFDKIRHYSAHHFITQSNVNVHKCSLSS
eukprot:m.75 g.75  ORF g.75 m.75 type:complete len:80 (-) comp22_c0_seq1:52-291(-)